MTRYPAISRKLKDQLELVTPSRDRDIEYYPCAVTLFNGQKFECVYIVEFEPYIRYWGVAPEEDSGKNSIEIQDVASIRESKFRLPAKLATEIYSAGESGMGYCIFTVEFSNGSCQAYITGNAVDFIIPPAGLAASNACGVYPHQGRDNCPHHGHDYFWCIYEGIINTA